MVKYSPSKKGYLIMFNNKELEYQYSNTLQYCRFTKVGHNWFKDKSKDNNITEEKCYR